MKIWIVVCGEAAGPLPKRCTGAAYEAALTAAEESPIEPYAGRTMKAAGRPVYIAPGRRARETAEQMIPDGEPVVEPLLAPIPRRAWKDTDTEYPFRVWERGARQQARRGDPRQPESRTASIGRAEALIARLEAEGKDAVLILDTAVRASAAGLAAGSPLSESWSASGTSTAAPATTTACWQIPAVISGGTKPGAPRSVERHEKGAARQLLFHYFSSL